MASIVNEVIKDTIKNAAINKVILTPDNYYTLFCEAAKKRGLGAPECNRLNDYISKLNPNLQKEVRDMGVRNVKELFAFMSSRLNRSNNPKEALNFQASLMLAKRVLEAISLLQNSKARALANDSLSSLKIPNEKILNSVRDKWLSFITEYDGSFLERLAQYGIKKEDDIELIISKLISSQAKKISSDKNYESIASLLVASLVPSIAPQINDELAIISDQLKDQPELIENEAMQEDVKNLTIKRVKLDKEEFKAKLDALDQILVSIDKQVKYYIDKFGVEDNTFEEIREDLSHINSNDEYKSVKTKLVNLANSLGENMKDFVNKLKSERRIIQNLKNKIKMLKKRLEETEIEAKKDFLTGFLTKRALNEELEKKEKEFNQANNDFSICFFDIDHFKKVNDTYGHDAGDAILAKIAGIIRDNSKDNYILGRFGGEEFVVVMPQTSLEDSILFSNKILDSVSVFKFIYQKSEFHITISAGIALRSSTNNYQETLRIADEKLYEAKNAGRNCVKY